LRREALEFAWDHPAYVAEVTGHNLLRLFELEGESVVGARNLEAGTVAAPDAVVEERGIGSATPAAERAGLAAAALFAVLGTVAIARSRWGPDRTEAGLPRYPTGPWFLWLVPVVMIAAAAPVNGLPRYRVPADPFLLILAAIGLVWAWERLGAIRARRGRGLKSATAALAAVAVVALTGCGGDDGDSESGGVASETATSTASVAAAEQEKQAYIAKVDRICRVALRQAKAIGDRFSLGGLTFTDAITRRLVAPGIPVAERVARQLQAVQPRPDDPDLEHFLSLSAPGLELLHQLLEAGRRGDLTEARRLELLLVDLGTEQRQAARRFGLRACDRDFSTELFREAFD
jgi:4-amino-4-deoxy-L-arabinose transferase-like glycosyltransferase